MFLTKKNPVLLKIDHGKNVTKYNAIAKCWYPKIERL